MTTIPDTIAEVPARRIRRGADRWSAALRVASMAGGVGLCLLCTTALAAQSDSATIRVTVLEEERGLAGVRLVAGTANSQTDASGNALLRVPSGSVRLQAARIGYLLVILELTIRPAADTALVITMTRAAVEMEDLVVSVTRSTRRLADQPLRIEVLGQEEIEEKVLMTPGDIAMMLNETGGLRVQNTSPSLGGANIRVQGLRGRYTLLLSDGLPLHGEQASGPGLLQVPPMDLGQVEVLKGAASAFHGSAALGGVINLLSRRPTGEREALLNVTSLGGTDAAAWLSRVHSPEWGSSLFLGWHRQGRADRDDDGWTDVPGYDRLVLRHRVYYEDGRGQSFFATLGNTREGRRGGTLNGRTAPDGTAWREQNTTNRFDGGLVGRFALGEVTFLAVRASGMSQRHRHRFGPTPEADRHLTGFLEAAVVSQAGPAAVVIGAAWQGDRYRSEAAPQFDFGYSVPAAFAQVEFDATNALAVAASARFDHHNVFGSFLSPRLSILARPGAEWTIRASGGAGYFGPTPLVEATEVTGLSGLVQPEPLRAERVIGGSLDIGVHVGDFEFNATAFGSRIRHPVSVVDQSTVDGDDQVLRNLEGPVRTWGGELLGRLHREGIHLTASYTYLRGREMVPDSPTSRREVPLNARHALGVVGMYEWEGSGRIGLELYYTGRQALEDNPYRSQSPAYTIIGALAEKQVGWARFFLNLENLTGTRQTRTDPLVRPTQGAGGRWTTDAWGSLEGRVVNGGVKLKW